MAEISDWCKGLNRKQVILICRLSDCENVVRCILSVSHLRNSLLFTWKVLGRIPWQMWRGHRQEIYRIRRQLGDVRSMGIRYDFGRWFYWQLKKRACSIFSSRHDRRGSFIPHAETGNGRNMFNSECVSSIVGERTVVSSWALTSLYRRTYRQYLQQGTFITIFPNFQEHAQQTAVINRYFWIASYNFFYHATPWQRNVTLE